MDWKGLRNHLIAQHPNDPGKIGRIEYGLKLAEEAILQLLQSGHQFHLEEGDGDFWPDWPCLLFHVDAAPNGRLVRDLNEAVQLGQGWFRTLQEAQMWDGTQTQFAGRGGVPRAGVPALGAPPTAQEIAEYAKELEAAKQAMIAEFKARKREFDAQQVR